jgi:hypothetical protein
MLFSGRKRETDMAKRVLAFAEPTDLGDGSWSVEVTSRDDEYPPRTYVIRAPTDRDAAFSAIDLYVKEHQDAAD